MFLLRRESSFLSLPVALKLNNLQNVSHTNNTMKDKKSYEELERKLYDAKPEEIDGILTEILKRFDIYR